MWFVERTLVFLAIFTVAGCVSHPSTLVSTNTDLLVVDKKPEGYPRTHMEPYPNFPGFCLEVKESWREDRYQGEVIWLKDKELKSMRCSQQ